MEESGLKGFYHSKTSSSPQELLWVNKSFTRLRLSDHVDTNAPKPAAAAAEEVTTSMKKKKKLGWLKSNLIGNEVELETPFGWKRRLSYADHTASGRCLHYIENYIIKNVLPFYGNTHTSDSYVGRKTSKMVKEATEYIKKCLGGGLNDALLFCGSGTTAAIKRLQEIIGISVPSTLREKILNSGLIKNEERWLVFIGPYEHHSNILSWRQSLAEVVEIGLDEHGLIDLETLRSKLEFYKCSDRPMLGSFSACSNVTGIYTDTRALARLLHQYGAFACFDFAASGPYVEIDMCSGDIEGYDAIFLSPHKFRGGPGSPGILLMNKALYGLRSSPPSTCGGGTVSYVNGFDEKDTLYNDDIEEREDAGTPPIIQKIRAALAFWVKEYIGYDLIEEKENFYIETALKRLTPNPNIWLLGNTKVKRQAVLSFLILPGSNTSAKDQTTTRLYELMKPLHGAFVVTLLNDLFGIQARGGCACAGPYGHQLLGVDEPLSLAFRSSIQQGYSGIKPGWTRISFSYYTSQEEFEFILSAIEFIAMYGDRFLPLYNFGWKTGRWTHKRRVTKESPISEFGHKLVDNLPCKQRQSKADKDVGMVSMFSSYLEAAKNMADALPKFCPRRRNPGDIDHKLLYFRI